MLNNHCSKTLLHVNLRCALETYVDYHTAWAAFNIDTDIGANVVIMLECAAHIDFSTRRYAPRSK